MNRDFDVCLREIVRFLSKTEIRWSLRKVIELFHGKYFNKNILGRSYLVWNLFVTNRLITRSNKFSMKLTNLLGLLYIYIWLKWSNLIKIKSLTIFIPRKLIYEWNRINFFFKMKKVNLGQKFRAVFNRTIHSFYFEFPISFCDFFHIFRITSLYQFYEIFLSFIVKKFSNIDKIFFPKISQYFNRFFLTISSTSII